MRFNLAFGLDHEAKVPAITAHPGNNPDAITAGVPERIQQARATMQFIEAIRAPGQVIGFLLRCREQLRARGFVVSHRRLTHIQRLCADLAGMVDAHQPGGMSARGFTHHDIGLSCTGIAAFGSRFPGCRSERALTFDEQSIQQ